MTEGFRSLVNRLSRAVCLIAAVVYPCCVNMASSADEITLQLSAEHQFRFAGYYAADWKGFYEAEDLRVRVKEGSSIGESATDVIEEVVTGRATFGLASTDLLTAHEAGEQLVVLAVVLQRSDVEFYTRETTVVSSPRDFQQLRLSSPPGERYQLLLRHALSIAGVEDVSDRYSITNSALEDLAAFKTDVIVGSSLITPYLAEKIDLDLVSIDPASFGFHAPGQTIFTTRQYLDQNPEIVSKFIRSSLEGWKYALKNSDELSLMVARKKLLNDGFESSFGMGFYQVDKVRQLAMYPVVRLGNTDISRWQGFHDEVASVLNLERPMEDDFVHDPYETLKNRVERIDYFVRLGLVALFFAVLCTAFVFFNRRSQWRRYERKLRDQATHDELTGLPNRACAIEELERWLINKRNSAFYVIFLDLDGFKAINDTCGHASGDEMLVKVSERLKQSLNASDWVARIGGDEFLVLSAADKSIDPLTARLLNCLRDPFIIDDTEHYIGGSIGVARYPDDGVTGQLLLSHADAAMYRAKDTGKNRVFHYAKELSLITEEKTNIGNRLKGALQRGEFYLCYQPIVSVSSNKVCGVEALIRWENPDLGFVPPDKFIPVAEETGVINDIGKWVLSRALEDMKRWNASLEKSIYVSVNVSARQFYKSDFNLTVTNMLSQSGVPAELLKLEITESLLVGDQPKTARMLNMFTESGIQIFMDDFGTGYSSLSYLKKFPVGVLKIDRSFTNGLPHDSKASSLVKAIVAMARGLDMKVVCEGVENDEQRVFLRNIGCDLAQGYHYSKPVKYHDLYRLLKADQAATESTPVSDRLVAV